MARNRIAPWYWHLWAVREAGSYPHLGYPSQEPWYQPARLSRVELDDDRPGRPPDADDWRMVDAIAEALALYRQRRPSEVRCLVIYEGAYPGADPDFETRCKTHQIAEETCRRMAGRARKAIDILLS
jgi:hypothetical protein